VAWRRVLEVRPDFDRAHYRIAGCCWILATLARLSSAAEAGIAVRPNSRALYVVKADALEKRGRMYDARNTLQQGTAVASDPALLSRLAVAEDTYGARLPMLTPPWRNRSVHLLKSASAPSSGDCRIRAR